MLAARCIRAISPESSSSLDCLAQRSWHFALADIAAHVADAEGDPFVKECARVLTTTTACMSARLSANAERVPNAFAPLCASTALWRRPKEDQQTLVDHACRHGASDEWRTDVYSVCAEF